MKYGNLIGALIESFPELKDAAQKEIDWWDGEEPPVHVFFGDVLDPFLIDELSSMKNPGLIDRVFEFLESMAVSEDEMVRGVLTDTILEKLGDDEGILDRARTFMRSRTKQLSYEVEEFLGREKGWSRK